MKRILKIFLCLTCFCLAITSVVACEKHAHTLQKVNKTQSTCTEQGNKVYYVCTDSSCGKIFTDEKGENETTLKEVKLPLLSHDVIFNAGKTAENGNDGIKENYECRRCGRFFTDSSCSIEIPEQEIVIKDTSQKLEFITSTFNYTYYEYPSTLEGYSEVVFCDYYVEGATDARAYPNLDPSYVFLKRDNKGDMIVEFYLDTTGYYELCIDIVRMPSCKRRVTNLKIDNSDFLLLDYQYEEGDKTNLHLYASGITAYLESGRHTITLSLPDIFNDEDIKSLFIHSFMYNYLYY